MARVSANFFAPEGARVMDDFDRTFNAPPTPSQTALVICSRCGASNPPVSEFCRKCGDAGMRPAAASAARRPRSRALVAVCAALLTAIPVIGLHVALTTRKERIHRAELAARTAELKLELGRARISLSGAGSNLREAMDTPRHISEQVSQSLKLSTLQVENAKLKAEQMISARRVKNAEEKYEDADLKLRNAKGELRELREELDACNSKQARTMQKLVETERRLRSAEARRSQGGAYGP